MFKFKGTIVHLGIICGVILCICLLITIVRGIVANYYYNRALSVAQNFNEHIILLNHAFENDPSNPDLHDQLGLAYLKEAKRRNIRNSATARLAEKSFKKAIYLSPVNANFHINLALSKYYITKNSIYFYQSLKRIETLDPYSRNLKKIQEKLVEKLSKDLEI